MVQCRKFYFLLNKIFLIKQELILMFLGVVENEYLTDHEISKRG